MHPIAQEALNELKESIRSFGVDGMYDKGLREYVDLDLTLNKLKPLADNEIVVILRDIIEAKKPRIKYDLRELLIQTLGCNLQDHPTAWDNEEFLTLIGEHQDDAPKKCNV